MKYRSEKPTPNTPKTMANAQTKGWAASNNLHTLSEFIASLSISPIPGETVLFVKLSRREFLSVCCGPDGTSAATAAPRGPISKVGVVAWPSKLEMTVSTSATVQFLTPVLYNSNRARMQKSALVSEIWLNVHVCCQLAARYVLLCGVTEHFSESLWTGTNRHSLFPEFWTNRIDLLTKSP